MAPTANGIYFSWLCVRAISSSLERSVQPKAFAQSKFVVIWLWPSDNIRHLQLIAVISASSLHCLASPPCAH
eukprot:7109823-Pyramimonas_sp.AAC.1